MFIITRPDNAEVLEVDGATVPFYRFVIDGIEYIEFDTSKSGPPEPMVNAMLALGFVKGPKTKVIMINHKKPMGLYDKIGDNFQIDDIKDGDNYKLIFSYRSGASEQADLSQKSCKG
jgi:hypothetical protein